LNQFSKQIDVALISTFTYGYVDLSLLFFQPFRIIGIDCSLHMLTDFIDCLFMYSRCEECFAGSPAIELLKATSRLIEFEYLNSSGEN
jgi:hypothetical protein